MCAYQKKGTSVPEVFISSEKNRQKIYEDNKVYLQNGDNFEIEIFNNQSEKIGFEIFLNDKLISDSLLVLSPGERIHLDRFLESNNKFLFETYNVDKNSEEVKKAIVNNGKIKVRCYKEEKIERYKTVIHEIWRERYPYNPWWGTNPYWYYYDTSGTITLDNSGTYTMDNSNLNASFTTTNTVNMNNTVSDNLNVSYSASMDSESNSLETGRVEKGATSEQKLDYTSFDPQLTHFYEVEYQILPKSNLNVTSKDIRNYCTNCGYRIRNSSWKHCPKCGEEL